MNIQDVFDTVVAHLRAQGKPALGPLDADYRCAYRGEGGTKCAVGCLIKDEHYSPALEGQSTFCLAVQDALASSGIAVDDQDVRFLLPQLQDIHDQFDPCEWEQRFAHVAKQSLLDYSPPAPAPDPAPAK